MLNKQQIKDSKKCDAMDMNDETMECINCSCSVCIAQLENNDYEQGLRKAIEIIDKEIEYAKTVNPVMTLGMQQVKALIIKELG